LGDPKRARAAQVAFLVSAAGACGLAAIYVLGGNPQIEGAMLGVMFGALSVGLVLWAKAEMRDEGRFVEHRFPQPTEEYMREREAMIDDVGRIKQTVPRRTFLLSLMAAAGAIGAVILFPLRSLGVKPDGRLFHTRWFKGSRLMTYDHEPVRVEDLVDGEAITVFPEKGVGFTDSAAWLIRVEPDRLELGARSDWAHDGYVLYSKMCTHAGCPVGLYRRSEHMLLCPCHQSQFDVLRGAMAVAGPAPRGLPQIPLGQDGEGYLVAESDFDEPVGPGFWQVQKGIRPGEPGAP
jgi:ubiquinol-cytochrome c reductase iron-sulfur subunit